MAGVLRGLGHDVHEDRRAVQSASANHGALGSGWAASSDGRSRSSASVRAATSSYACRAPASVSPSVSRKLSANSTKSSSVMSSKSLPGPIATGPSTMKAAQFRSTRVTCLISPPMVSSLAVLRSDACSVVSSRAVNRRKKRALVRQSSRSARSPVRVAVASVSMVMALMICPLLPPGGPFPRARERRYGR